MMSKRGVPFIIILVLLLNEGVDAFAQYCFKKAAMAQGASSIFNFSEAFAFVAGAARQEYLWLGVAAVALVFVSWTIVLSKVDLSVATPMTSFSYVFVAVISMAFLHERITPYRWAGIVLILIGVAIVSMSSHRKEEGPP